MIILFFYIMFNKIIIKWLLAFDILFEPIIIASLLYMCILNHFKVYFSLGSIIIATKNIWLLD